jgi:hypothetical protein
MTTHTSEPHYSCNLCGCVITSAWIGAGVRFEELGSDKQTLTLVELSASDSHICQLCTANLYTLVANKIAEEQE